MPSCTAMRNVPAGNLAYWPKKGTAKPFSLPNIRSQSSVTISPFSRASFTANTCEMLSVTGMRLMLECSDDFSLRIFSCVDSPPKMMPFLVLQQTVSHKLEIAYVRAGEDKAAIAFEQTVEMLDVLHIHNLELPCVLGHYGKFV